jgi:hypothetical protein
MWRAGFGPPFLRLGIKFANTKNLSSRAKRGIRFLSPNHPTQPSCAKLLPMDPTRDLGRTLLILGAILIAAGALLYFSARLPLRLGRLPGDIVHRSEHTTFYFPITTSIFLSVALTLILWLISHFRR